MHPFCSSFATTDIRMTTRYAETDLHSLFSSMHECGHGLYEHGVDPALERTPLCNGVSSGAARVAEPPVGEPRRPLAAVLALVLSEVEAAFPDVLGRRRGRRLLPRGQPGRSPPSSASTPTR